jgi:7-keto-8-aminopelargonate synthetase-like enzyme
MTKPYAEPLQQIDRTYVLWRGRKLSYFAGCDYLRLSSHPAVLKAARKALDTVGLNVSASRKTTGNHAIYSELEDATRRFFNAECAVISSTGYFTNIIASQALRGSIDRVFIDERAHGSLRDAALFLDCRIESFAHCDPSDLEKKFNKRSDEKIAVLTDGMFSHDGALAPLAKYREVIGPNALLWVDDAHAGGIIGKNGRGSVEEARLSRRNLIQTITFSKAFGTYGGAILCSGEVGGAIIERSAAVGGNTPTPLPLAYATVAALKLCDANLRSELFNNIRAFWKRLDRPARSQLTPIIAACPENPSALRRKLLAAEIYPPLIKYPGGPAEGYFRFALSSEHSARQINALADVLSDFREALQPSVQSSATSSR